MLPTIATGNVGSALAGEYEVANSLRFDDGSSDYLNRTQGTPTNADKFTLSVWVKRCGLTTSDYHYIASFDGGSNPREHIRFNDTTDQLTWYFRDSGGTATSLTTNRLFRDVSAWYHIVCSYDSTQSTSSNRQKIYVNGVQETSFSSSGYVAQNTDSNLNTNSNNIKIGALGVSSPSAGFFDGYMAEYVFIDGQALDPTSFGEFSEDENIWRPIDVSGLTFGTNGFYLDFENSGSLGADVSGNGNNFTVNNLTSIDQSTDTCTNNFATLNSLVKAPSSITFSEGNLKAVHPGSWTGVPATIGVQSGKWYWECKITTGNSANAFTGICVEDINFNDSTVYDETGMITYFANGRKTVDGTETASFFSSLSTGDIVGVALDLDSGTRTVTFTKNGSASGSAVNLTSNFDNKFIFPVGIGNSSSATANWEFNFGSPPYSESGGNSDGNGYGNFSASVPSGHFALNTKNLAEYG